MFVVAAAPSPAAACSGPGAMAAIQGNERLGWILWGTTLLAAAAFASHRVMRARGWRRQWPLALFVMLHPGWWMSARHGDCGYTLRDGSILFLGLTLVAGAVMLWRARRAASAG
jgi:hypothetical protein